MGLDEFSMSAISVPRIKKLIRHVNYQEVKALADEALQKPTAAEIEQLIQAFFSRKIVKLDTKTEFYVKILAIFNR